MKVKKIISVYDGDTFCVNLYGSESIISEKISIRIDAPEIKNSNAKLKALAVKARKYIKYRLLNSKKIILKNTKRDKYFRIRATVLVNNKDISKELLERKLAIV